MARIFGYGRASTDKQQITLLSQEQVCQNYFNLRHAQNESWEYAGWFPDPAVTSKIPMFERPMGAKIFGMINQGDTIVISNFDRAFRSVIDCDNCMRISNEKRFGLVILDADVDTQTPLGRAFMKIIAVLKELEREEVSRRTKEALQYNLRMGKRHSTGYPIGWEKGNKDQPMMPSLRDRHWAKEVVRLYDTRNLDFRKIVTFFRKKDIRTPQGKFWHLRRVRLSYVSAKCGFPRLYTKDLPGVRDLTAYMNAHAGRPPRLQRNAVLSGLLHTLPPMMDPVPVDF